VVKRVILSEASCLSWDEGDGVEKMEVCRRIYSKRREWAE